MELFKDFKPNTEVLLLFLLWRKELRTFSKEIIHKESFSRTMQKLGQRKCSFHRANNKQTK